MKRTVRALSLLGTMALGLPACGDHLTPNAPDQSSQSTTAGQTGVTTPDMTQPDSTQEQLPGTETKSSSGQSSSASTPDPTTSIPDLGTSSSAPTSSPGTSSQESDSSDTGPIVVPAPYAGMTNPLDPTDTGVILAGGLRFKKNCGCHVAESQSHDPEAPDLGRGESSKRADDWMFWRVSEGVAPKMGPFKDTFNETERWQIISYLRALTSKNESDNE